MNVAHREPVTMGTNQFLPPDLAIPAGKGQ
jgi:hypothetical protein